VRLQCSGQDGEDSGAHKRAGRVLLDAEGADNVAERLKRLNVADVHPKCAYQRLDEARLSDFEEPEVFARLGTQEGAGDLLQSGVEEGEGEQWRRETIQERTLSPIRTCASSLDG
jgi:hypothetical protein